MKNIAIAILLLLGTAYSAKGQSSVDFAKNAIGPSELTESFAMPAAKNSFGDSMPASFSPQPQPSPRFVYGGRDDFRWEIGMLYTYVRFRSGFGSQGMNGFAGTVAYYTSDWLGVEANITSAFGSGIFGSSSSKYLSYAAGPKIAIRKQRWEPWVHVLAGGSHFAPKLTTSSQTGFAVIAGGGADYRWKPGVAFRLEGDWVRTQFFSSTQNNFQIQTGIVFHF